VKEFKQEELKMRSLLDDMEQVFIGPRWENGRVVIRRMTREEFYSEESPMPMDEEMEVLEDSGDSESISVSAKSLAAEVLLSSDQEVSKLVDKMDTQSKGLGNSVRASVSANKLAAEVILQCNAGTLLKTSVTMFKQLEECMETVRHSVDRPEDQKVTQLEDPVVDQQVVKVPEDQEVRVPVDQVGENSGNPFWIAPGKPVVGCSMVPFGFCLGGRFGQTISNNDGLPKDKIKLPPDKVIPSSSGTQKSCLWGEEAEKSLRSSGSEKPAPPRKKERFKTWRKYEWRKINSSFSKETFFKRKRQKKMAKYRQWMFQEIEKEQEFFNKSDGRKLQQMINIQQQIWNSGNEARTTGGEEEALQWKKSVFARLMEKKPSASTNVYVKNCKILA
jgi:hypothetical protein